MFIIINLFLCIATSTALFCILLKKRYLFIKPSIIVLLFYNLAIQWGATSETAFINLFLPDPLVFWFLLHGFLGIGLLLSYFIANKSAKYTWERLAYQKYAPSEKAIMLLLLLVILILIFYIHYVPFTKSGLYAILYNPILAGVQREESLKLLDNELLKYTFAFLESCFAPLLTVMLAYYIYNAARTKMIIKSVFGILLLFCLFFVVSLPGDRSDAALLILVIIIAFSLQRGLPIRPIYIFAGVMLFLFLPTLLTLLRENRELNIGIFFDYLMGQMFHRVFITPMETAVWHVHYAQSYGFLGVSGIEKLAILFGKQPLWLPNIVGKIYARNALESVSANTGWLFSYYSCFGLKILPLCIIQLLILDFILILYKNISDCLLLPLVSAITLVSIKFCSGDYTIILITHGFVILPLTAMGLDYLIRIKLKT